MPPWEAEAIHHARVMNKYLEAHSTSATILAQDPTRRDKLASALKESTAPNVRHALVHDDNDDVPALFRDWNGAIEREPTTFEDHFYRVHYAWIAAAYYEFHIMSPLVEKHGLEFLLFYQKELQELHMHSASAVAPEHLPQPHLDAGRRMSSCPPSDRPNIDRATAVAFLADPEALLAARFFHRDEDGFWLIKSVSQKTTRDGSWVAFQIVHGDEPDDFEVDSEVVMDLLLGSCIG